MAIPYSIDSASSLPWTIHSQFLASQVISHCDKGIVVFQHFEVLVGDAERRQHSDDIC